MLKAPPMMGPVAKPSWLMPMFSPIKRGCLRVGRDAAMVLKAPVAMPEHPRPAMARPTINMEDDWAAPQSADPTSNMKKKTRKHHWTVAC